MLFSKEISGLKATITDLEGKLNAANGNVEALTQEKATLEARVKELEAAQTDAVPKADHDAALKLQADEIADLQGKLAAAEKNKDKAVVETIASAGVPAAKRDPAAVDMPGKPAAGNGQTYRTRLAAMSKTSDAK